MNAVINERLNESGSLEIIRNQLAGILAVEMAHQYELAVADSDPVADDYSVDVLVENDEPIPATGGANSFPLINVSVEKTEHDGGSSNVNTTKRQAYINIDCYQTGNYSGPFAGRTAAVKAWKLARCVQKILDSDYYTYLLLRGLVDSKYIGEVKGGVPDMDSAIKVVVVRIQLVVSYNSNAPQSTGLTMNILPVQISDEHGKVVIDILEEE